MISMSLNNLQSSLLIMKNLSFQSNLDKCYQILHIPLWQKVIKCNVILERQYTSEPWYNRQHSLRLLTQAKHSVR